MRDSIQIMITMGVYMLVVIGIGFIFAKRANKSSESYFLGGRTLGPWVTAMSAGGLGYVRLAADGASRRCLLGAALRMPHGRPSGWLSVHT